MSEKEIIKLLNQLFEIEKKSAKSDDAIKIDRNIARIKSIFEEQGIIMKNPLHESYQDTRTDIDAEIDGDPSKKLMITEVLKPILYKDNQLIQKGLVIVEN